MRTFAWLWRRAPSRALFGALACGIVAFGGPTAWAQTALPTGVTTACDGQPFAQAQVPNLPTVSIQVASTEQQRETGLMNRTTLDWDEGMLFVFQTPSFDAFWMHDTLIPLSIAWMDPNGQILDVQDMQAQTDTLHQPPVAYSYALEVNQGWFAANNVTTGATMSLCLGSS